MGGHHLILGTLRDFITDDVVDDTHDERYRQKIARFLVSEKGYRKAEIHPHHPLVVAAGDRRGRLWVDYTVTVDDRALMVIKYAPGSLVTRHRSTLAISRLVASYQIPVVVVTNGEDADILDGEQGRMVASGFDRIPSRAELLDRLEMTVFSPISTKRAEMEARIVYAFEIDGGCPCDDTACRIA
ncbi:type I restriction enzyme HsdR N-terminal domain-containing protein [Desulfosarcina ovata]|uniref:Type I restriction enzyme R protein N-terminal domain-containing protein n=1 Tax=Desulfosarcina ovata subsp. ovata TaxID=2752305 RepID=A0A5K8AH47_9BACT|nr:type I restriction enzyme HsdR N-terminal domain-containing protein [Desulfosarcina ovata]BBO91888.1 hypothetical protein DSCOOX_50680 [Desulfosarcina ovata subsp. ovata]